MNVLYAWGQGLREDAYGRNAILWEPSPLAEFNGDVAGLSLSENRLLVWDESGSAFSWYQTDGKSTSRCWQREPQLPDGYAVLEAACSDTHTVAVAESGAVYSWGHNLHGELGVRSPSKNQSAVPVRMHTDGKQIAGVCAGWHVTGLLTSSGELLLHGRDGGLRLTDERQHGGGRDEGHGEIAGQLVRLSKAVLSQHQIVQLSCGGTHSAAVTKEGVLLSWGHDRYGQLGHGALPDLEELVRQGQGCPVTRVQYFDGIHMLQVAGLWLRTDGTQVACGEAHTVALDEAGAVYSWGWNAYGQLGLKNTANRKIPRRLAIDTLVSAVSAGWAHSMAVTTNQRILSWGWGKFGQLGRCEAVNDCVPKLIPEIEGAAGWPRQRAADRCV